MPRGKRGPGRPRKERDVTKVHMGTPFVADGGEVHGTPSNTNPKEGRVAYAASSVIERGTANKLKIDLSSDQERLCLCGCGQQPSQADSLFMPGHDSKVRAMGKAILEGRLERKNVYKPALEYLEQGGMLQ